jgi:glycosyltransferase involved in cell wall biosynthesis
VGRTVIMRTLQIGLTWAGKSAGGADRIFADLATSLPLRGVNFVGAVAGPSNLDRSTAGLVHSFAAEESSTTTRLRGARKTLIGLLGSEKPDLVASHFALYTVPILDKLSVRPFVMHFHGPWAMETRDEGAAYLSTIAKRTLERAVYRRANRVVVLSKAFGDLLSLTYGINQDSIRVVPGAINLHNFRYNSSRTEARELLGWPTNRPILLTVRRLVHRMGLHKLLDAMPRILEREPDVLLCIGGTGPMRPLLEEKALRINLGKNVHFLGFIDEERLPVAYRAANISVIPSIALEGFGLVAAESLAAGTPVMVTPVGGLPEVVRALSSDLIFETGSPVDIADGLVAALSGKTRLPTESACREYANSNFSLDLMSSRIVSIYQELLS